MEYTNPQQQGQPEPLLKFLAGGILFHGGNRHTAKPALRSGWAEELLGEGALSFGPRARLLFSAGGMGAPGTKVKLISKDFFQIVQFSVFSIERENLYFEVTSEVWVIWDELGSFGSERIDSTKILDPHQEWVEEKLERGLELWGQSKTARLLFRPCLLQLNTGVESQSNQ